jgi:hypothetical protein
MADEKKRKNLIGRKIYCRSGNSIEEAVIYGQWSNGQLYAVKTINDKPAFDSFAQLSLMRSDYKRTGCLHSWSFSEKDMEKLIEADKDATEKRAAVEKRTTFSSAEERYSALVGMAPEEIMLHMFPTPLKEEVKDAFAHPNNPKLGTFAPGKHAMQAFVKISRLCKKGTEARTEDLHSFADPKLYVTMKLIDEKPIKATAYFELPVASGCAPMKKRLSSAFFRSYCIVRVGKERKPKID